MLCGCRGCEQKEKEGCVFHTLDSRRGAYVRQVTLRAGWIPPPTDVDGEIALGCEDKSIGCRATIKDFISGPAEQRILIAIAQQGIVTRATVQPVIAAVAEDKVTRAAPLRESSPA